MFIACLFKGSQEQSFFLQTLLFTAFLATVLKILTYAFVSTWSLVSSAWEHFKRKCTAVNIYVKSEKRISPCLSHLFQIVWNLCPGWLLCLMRKKGFCSLLTSLILSLYYKLNWPKRASAVYWLLGTLLYPWLDCVTLVPILRKLIS